MKTWRRFAVCLAVVASLAAGRAQTTRFDIEAYTQFLASHSALLPAEMQSMYPAGTFLSSVSHLPANPSYLDSIIAKYGLTPFELELLSKRGFVVMTGPHGVYQCVSWISGFADLPPSWVQFQS